jgi:hypothetical protein
MRRLSCAMAILAVAGLAFSASASAAPAAGAVDCIGLTCPESAGGMPGYAQGRWSATTVLGPSALAAQKAAGFYEFGHGTTLGRTAVAYVIPQGQVGSVPEAVRKLPIMRDVPPSDYQTGTVVIFGSSVELWVPGTPTAGTARTASRRPRAHAAAADPYGCSDQYFCIYENVNFTGAKLQWHDINSGSNWTQLPDWGFNDRASSSRNRRDRDSWLAENLSGGGARHCYDSHSSDANFGGFGDQASSTYNSAGDAGC